MYRFDWDEAKNKKNIQKHGISFEDAIEVFKDNNRVIIQDIKHSKVEKRLYCIGLVQSDILTVRYTLRGNTIRIFGAGYWRDGKKLYEKTNKI